MSNFIATLGILDGVIEAFQGAVEFLLNAGFEAFLKFASFGDVLNKSYGILPEYKMEHGTLTGPTPGAISPFLDISASFGGALALIFLFVAIIDTYTQEKMSLETFAKPFFQYLITMVLLTNVEKVIAGFWSFGVLFQFRMMDKFDQASFASQLEFSFPENASLGFCLGMLLAGIVILIISLLLGLVIRVCAYIANFSRMIEAGVRGLGMPIAIGMCSDSSLRQGAMRYLRKFFAVALQGGIFVAISLIFSVTAISLITETTETLGKATMQDLEVIETEFVDPFKEHFNEVTGELILAGVDGVQDVVSLGKSALPPIVLAESIGTAIVAILSMIVPLFGLGLGSIVVLFKSGQICNDIVGA